MHKCVNAVCLCVFLLTHLNFCVSEPNLFFFFWLGTMQLECFNRCINSCFPFGLKNSLIQTSIELTLKTGYQEFIYNR